MFSLKSFQEIGCDLFYGGMNNSHSGNLSTKNNRLMAISKSGSMLHRLNFDDIIETLIDGEDSETKKASREIPVHRAIYINTEAEAIVHAHPPHVIALTLQTNCIAPVDAEGDYYFPDGMPVISVENAIASNEVAQKVVPYLKEFPIVGVKGHGTFAIGKTLEEAFHWTSSIEHSAKIILLGKAFPKNLNLI